MIRLPDPILAAHEVPLITLALKGDISETCSLLTARSQADKHVADRSYGEQLHTDRYPKPVH